MPWIFDPDVESDTPKKQEILALAYFKNIHNHVVRMGFTNLASVDGRHRCQAKGDKVFMADGSWKNVEDIKVGDKVISPQSSDGKIVKAKVMAVHKHFEKEVYDVVDSISNEKLYTCSKDHKIPLSGIIYRKETAEVIAKYPEPIGTYKFEMTDKKRGSLTEVRIRCVRTKPQNVYGFTLNSPSNLFITNDWMLTSNSGKSLFAILLAYLLDPTFWANFDKRVVSTPDEYVAAVMDIRDKGYKGAVIVVDEAGVSMASSDYYESFMKTISKMIQMYGYLCIQTFFCAPNKDFVDSRLRRMFHSYYRVERFSNDYSLIFPYAIKYSSMVHKYFYRHPVINYQGERIIMNRIKIMKPPQFIIDRYQQFANAHKDKMLNDFMTELHNQKMQAARKIVNIEDLLKTVIDDPKPHLKTTCGENEYYFDIERIAHNLKIGRKLAQSIKFDAESHYQRQAKLNPPAPKPVSAPGAINIFKRKPGRPPGARNKVVV
jgi:hypothetical protein